MKFNFCARKRSLKLISLVLLLYPLLGRAGDSLKLPFLLNEQYLITRGYETAPTHVGKERLALDFAQDGCTAYQKNTNAYK